MSENTVNSSVSLGNITLSDADLAMLLQGKTPDSLLAKAKSIQEQKEKQEKIDKIKDSISSLANTFISNLPSAESIPSVIKSITFASTLMSAKEDKSQNILASDITNTTQNLDIHPDPLLLDLVVALSDQPKAVKTYFESVLTKDVLDKVVDLANFRKVRKDIEDLKSSDILKNLLIDAEIPVDTFIKLTWKFKGMEIAKEKIKDDSGNESEIDKEIPASWNVDVYISDKPKTSTSTRAKSATSKSISETGRSKLTFMLNGKKIKVGNVISDFPEDNPLRQWYEQHKDKAKTIDAASYYARQQLGDDVYFKALTDGGIEILGL